MKVKKVLHRFHRRKRSCPFDGIGRWQYIYSSSKGKISLIKLPNYFGDGQDFWEIYSLEGDLFEDVERFKTKKEAEEKIKNYLD